MLHRSSFGWLEYRSIRYWLMAEKRSFAGIVTVTRDRRARSLPERNGRGLSQARLTLIIGPLEAHLGHSRFDHLTRRLRREPRQSLRAQILKCALIAPLNCPHDRVNARGAMIGTHSGSPFGGVMPSPPVVAALSPFSRGLGRAGKGFCST